MKCRRKRIVLMIPLFGSISARRSTTSSDRRNTGEAGREVSFVGKKLAIAAFGIRYLG